MAAKSYYEKDLLTNRVFELNDQPDDDGCVLVNELDLMLSTDSRRLSDIPTDRHIKVAQAIHACQSNACKFMAHVKDKHRVKH